MMGRILIADDVATNRIVLKVKLAEASYDPVMTSSGAACLGLARIDRPDVILIDRMLPDADGIEVVAQLRADPATRDIPIVLTLPERDMAGVLAGLAAGADDVMTKPIDDQRLMARLRAFLRARDGVEDLRMPEATLGAVGMAEAGAAFERPGVVALITSRPETALLLRGTLSHLMSDRLTILTRDEALNGTGAAGKVRPDAYLIEADLGPAGSGLRLMSDLRSRAETRHAAICMILPEAAGVAAAMAFDLGADDALEGPADPREVALRLRHLMVRKRRADTLRATLANGLRLAVIDPLTGLHNRRYGLAHLGRLLDRTRRTRGSLAVLVIDLDRFKSVNDAFGHAAGDAVLTEVARRLGAALRADDLLARIGGEEFLVALPDTSIAEEAPIRLDEATALSVTVSIGLATARHPAKAGPEAVAALIDRADQALLRSKARGRNTVTICRPAA
jgi:two-component system, cell cycle response regulator